MHGIKLVSLLALEHMTLIEKHAVSEELFNVGQSASYTSYLMQYIFLLEQCTGSEQW